MELFEKIENFLKREKKFLSYKAKLFKDEVCNLVSLEKREVKMKKKMYYLFGDNMFKYRGFSNALKFLKRDVSQKIKENINFFRYQRNGNKL